jgi:hypothetical protein
MDDINIRLKNTGFGLLATIGFPREYLQESPERERNLMKV